MTCIELKLFPLCGMCSANRMPGNHSSGEVNGTVYWCLVDLMRLTLASSKRGLKRNIIVALQKNDGSYLEYLCRAIRQYYPHHIQLMDKVLLLR